MIIVMKPCASKESIKNVVGIIEGKGLDVHLSEGKEVTIIGVVGDKTKLRESNIEIAPEVDKIVEVTESYKLANKKFHPEATSITVGSGVVIGPDTFTMIAGPCAVEGEEQMLTNAKGVKAAGATILRGGAYKPRTSPYSFQGLEVEGLKYLQQAGKEYGLATICEVISRESIESAVDYVDMLQIGARNMQNFHLLKEVGKTKLPVLLKRGMCATIDEWLNAAEYIIDAGNPNVILCERGIRTYETTTRNTLDVSAIPVLKSKTHLPIIVDPSHASGVRDYILPLSRAALACGCDGLEVEVHNDPSKALSDGAQSLTIDQFTEMIEALKPFAKLMNKEM